MAIPFIIGGAAVILIGAICSSSDDDRIKDNKNRENQERKRIKAEEERKRLKAQAENKSREDLVEKELRIKSAKDSVNVSVKKWDLTCSDYKLRELKIAVTSDHKKCHELLKDLKSSSAKYKTHNNNLTILSKKIKDIERLSELLKREHNL